MWSQNWWSSNFAFFLPTKIVDNKGINSNEAVTAETNVSFAGLDQQIEAGLIEVRESNECLTGVICQNFVNFWKTHCHPIKIF